MERFLRTFQRIVSDLSPEYVGFTCLGIVIWIGCLLLSRKLGPRQRFLAHLALGFMALRFVLLGNPFAWYGYGFALNTADVGYRQCDIISRYPKRVFNKKPTDLRYLVVGSSQVPAVFFKYSQAHEELDLYWLSAFRPLDYVMYQDDIVAHRPYAVVLFLSELDIARMPRFDAAAIGPAQGLQFPVLASTLLSRSPGRDSIALVKDLSIGELFPEAKYSWIFKGLARKYLCVRSQDPLPTSQEVMPDEMLQPEWIDFNIACLRDFVQFLSEHGIRTVLIEGQYNPDAYSKHCCDLNQQVKSRLQGMTADLRQFIFVSREECPQLPGSDYHDFVHLDQQAGLTFSNQVMPLIESRLSVLGTASRPQ